jgi:hypothetical protein
MSNKSPKSGGRPWTPLSLCLIALLILSLGLNLYYYEAYISSEQRYARLLAESRKIISVDLLIEFNNGTRIWHNGTSVLTGWTLLNLTIVTTAGMVEYRTSYGSAFITGIYGVKGSGALYWLWYSWNSTARDWASGMSGADQYVLQEGDILAWYLADTSNYPHLPKP